jgi:8-oxo-dGTP pyrophosphatase MutT (NUDIX family)
LYRRVVAYVVRDGVLLVFDHRDVPEAGTQLPAGTVEDSEDPATAVVREVLEECGVRAEVVRELGFTDTIAPKRGEPRRNFFFELTTDDPRDEWEHVVGGGGGDEGMVFVCRFVPRDGLPPLAGDDDFLDEL